MLAFDVEIARRQVAVRCALTVAPGERIGLVGPSGAGKTTVLEAVAGLVALDGGEVRLGDRLLSRGGPRPVSVGLAARRVGLLRQEPGLFPHLTVAEHLAYAPRREAGGRGDRWAAVLGLDGVLGERPASLSGGQAQRVALGRLLGSAFEALLLDEPFHNIDPAGRAGLTEVVRDLVAESRVPGILVTHDLAEAQAFGDRVGVMEAGELLQVGRPDALVRRPATRRVAELVGYRAFLAGPGGTTEGIHPARVVPGAWPGRGREVHGRVRRVRPAGARFLVEVAVAPGTVVPVELDRPVPPGHEVALTALDPPTFGSDGRLVGDRTGARVPGGSGASADRKGDDGH